MMRAAVWAVMSIGGAALTTCVTAPPRPAPEIAQPIAAPAPPPPLLVPDGCLANLSGRWRPDRGLGVDYEAIDDGGVVELVARLAPTDTQAPAPRRFSRDGGLAWLVRDAGAPPSDSPERPGPSATLVLTRSSTGFEGVVASRRSQRSACTPQFPARVVACADDRLELETIMSARFDAECRRLDGGAWTAQTLLRVPPAPPADSASPDASWLDADGG
ncbi:MAG: hypothetical protein SFW67_27405 [Myxococcaceae bacterium]|nr:hypothetical protein [Myxococcaceae bacterium]